MKRINKIVSLLCVLSFCVLALAFPVNAVADGHIITPSSVLQDVTIDGTIKTAHYNFDAWYWYIRTYDNGTGEFGGYAKGSMEVVFPEGTTYLLLRCFPFGSYQAEGGNLVSGSTSFDVSDILPGSPIDFSYEVWCDLDWTHVLEVTVKCRLDCYYYDSNGLYLGVVEGDQYVETLVSDGANDETSLDVHAFTVSGSFPANAYYIVPCIRFDILPSEDGFTFTFGSSHFDLYVDIDTVLENSNTLNSINDKLADVNNTLGSIDSALNADADIDAGVSDFSGAADDINNAMQSAGTVMNAGSDSVSDIVNSSAMTGTIQSLAAGLSVAFSDEFQINLCGMSFNPFALWVTVIGGFSLIALTVAYLFRKRGQ